MIIHQRDNHVYGKHLEIEGCSVMEKRWISEHGPFINGVCDKHATYWARADETEGRLKNSAETAIMIALHSAYSEWVSQIALPDLGFTEEFVIKNEEEKERKKLFMLAEVSTGLMSAQTAFSKLGIDWKEEKKRMADETKRLAELAARLKAQMAGV